MKRTAHSTHQSARDKFQQFFPDFLAWWQLTSQALNYKLPYFTKFTKKTTYKLVYKIWNLFIIDMIRPTLSISNLEKFRLFKFYEATQITFELIFETVLVLYFLSQKFRSSDFFCFSASEAQRNCILMPKRPNQRPTFGFLPT